MAPQDCSRRNCSTKFARSRSLLDARFHNAQYSPERQELQDALIENFLRPHSNREASAHPTIIFLAGAMGSGKTYTRNYFAKDLESFLIIDQDEIRCALPEWGSSLSEECAAMLQRESGMLSEIVLSEAMFSGWNIVVDTSLRNTAWWKKEFERIREEFSYKIVIFHVRSTLEVAIQRAEKRAKLTGRVVPKSLVGQSFFDSANTVKTLAHSADLHAEICTNERVPKITIMGTE